MKIEYIEKALQAIADGYDYFIVPYSRREQEDGHVVQIENPDYKEDDGSHKYLVLGIEE